MKKTINKALPITFVIALCAGLSIAMNHISYRKAFAGEVGSYDDATRLPSMSFYGDTKTQMGFCWTTGNITRSDLQVVEKTKCEASTGFNDPSLKIKYYEGRCSEESC